MMRRTLSMTVGLCLIAASASAGPLDDLAAGELYEVPNSHLRDVAHDWSPDPTPGNVGGIIKAWGGGAFDTQGERLLILGGGHGDYGGNEIYALDLDTPPLHQFGRGSDAFAQENYGIDPTVTAEAISNFEQHFMMLALGRARELGYRTDALIAYFGQHYVGVLTELDYNPYLIANGRTPTVQVGGSYFTTWAGLKSGYDGDWQARDGFPLTDAEHGYDFLALAATSYVRDLPGGDAAWAFMASQALNASVLDDNPKWAVIPR